MTRQYTVLSSGIISAYLSGWVLSPRRSGRRRGCAFGDGTVAAASGYHRVGQRYQEMRVAEGKRKLVAETDRRRRGDGATCRRPRGELNDWPVAGCRPALPPPLPPPAQAPSRQNPPGNRAPRSHISTGSYSATPTAMRNAGQTKKKILTFILFTVGTRSLLPIQAGCYVLSIYWRSDHSGRSGFLVVPALRSFRRSGHSDFSVIPAFLRSFRLFSGHSGHCNQ